MTSASKKTGQSQLFHILVIIATVSFAILTFFAKQSSFFYFDLVVTRSIQSFNAPWFDSLMRFMSQIGDWPNWAFVLSIITAIFWYKKMIKPGYFLFVSVLGGLVLSELFKTLVGRVRPDPNLIHQLAHFIRSDSFPSGHVMFATTLFGFLLFDSVTHPRKTPIYYILNTIYLILIPMMGLSRIYLGAHWFSDVLGAYLLAFLWLSLVVFISHRFKA